AIEVRVLCGGPSAPMRAAPASPPPRAGEGQGGGKNDARAVSALSPTLQPKSDVSDFGRLTNWPISGKPEIGCKRGRERTDFAARAGSIPTGYGLISRFRSSHHCGSRSFANFGIEEGAMPQLTRRTLLASTAAMAGGAALAQSPTPEPQGRAKGPA